MPTTPSAAIPRLMNSLQRGAQSSKLTSGSAAALAAPVACTTRRHTQCARTCECGYQRMRRPKCPQRWQRGWLLSPTGKHAPWPSSSPSWLHAAASVLPAPNHPHSHLPAVDWAHVHLQLHDHARAWQEAGNSVREMERGWGSGERGYTYGATHSVWTSLPQTQLVHQQLCHSQSTWREAALMRAS